MPLLIFPIPTEPTSAEGWKVLTWLLILVCAGMGLLGVGGAAYAVWLLQIGVAAKILVLSLCCWMFAGGIYGTLWVFENFFE